jgi:small nuclear ribonucleoprotein (snRNP)-like protein
MASSDNEVLKSIMGCRTRLTLRDGRILDGTLACVDRQKNFVLFRAIGMVRNPPPFLIESSQTLMVPGNLVQKVEVLTDESGIHQAPSLLVS